MFSLRKLWRDQGVPRRKHESGRISIFRGREARLNRAIFHVLAIKGQLTVYDVYKELKTRRKLRNTRYATVNKRIRALEELGYIRRMGVKRTKAGFKASIYELGMKACLAVILNSLNFEDLLRQVDESNASEISAAIIYVA